jgi:tRNA-splicing ligase RtcB (3'-phosphate/5'-hydroxy nucleic acid ligase)
MDHYTFITKNNKEVKVFLPEKEIDTETKKQIQAISNNPTSHHIRFMPDSHKGHGCCVGFTSIIKNGIIPNYVGGDIGCGLSCYPLKFTLREKKYPKIEQNIRNYVPMGNGHNKVHSNDITLESDWKWLYDQSNQHALHLFKLFPNNEKIIYNNDWYYSFSERIKTNMEYDKCSLGTLGGGNHFIEINKDNCDQFYVTVHSGSRNLGQKVCRYHQNILTSKSKFNWKTYQLRVKKMKKKITSKKERKLLEDIILQEMKNELTGEKYLSGTGMYNYLIDMIFTQNYAALNRRIMLRNIIQTLKQGISFQEKNIIETIHNYIDFDKMIVRKGAISAGKNEMCLIALNMRDGILLCKGKGNEDWNYSSAHGSGRVLNRSEGSRLKLKEFQKQMKNVYSTCVVKETLDESPMAYRDSELIKKCLEKSVDIIDQLYPVINVKGY